MHPVLYVRKLSFNFFLSEKEVQVSRTTLLYWKACNISHLVSCSDGVLFGSPISVWLRM